jgi:hypothetical protein
MRCGYPQGTAPLGSSTQFSPISLVRPMRNVEVFWVLVALVAIGTALAVALMVVG